VDVIAVSSQRRRQLVDVTSFVQESVAASEVVEGVCQVCVPHTTAAVILNENADPAVGEDILLALEAMLPKVAWRHAEGNSDAHLLSALVGHSVSVPISGGELSLGRWQAVFLLELDGPRKRELWITCLRA
jgi:secondary thiamine-phosphate synthase enzyme